MPKPSAEEIRDRARLAAVESAPPASVGDFVGFIDEAEDVITMKFASRQKGYADWNWHVTLFVGDEDLTVSEVNLLPSETSLLAPDWVPWADRLADWKALQAELEAQAAAEAAEAADDAEEDSDESGEVDDAEKSDDEVDEAPVELEVESVETAAANDEEELPVALEEYGDESETNTDDAGKRPPRFLRRRLGRLKKKK